MHRIGRIVKLCREKEGMSQKELSRDICSQKYIFLIEKGERTPSTLILRKLSGRLKVNLFDLYQFIECVDPVEVYETINMFEKHKSRGEYDLLKVLNDSKKARPDFKKIPWCCEIIINDCTYRIFKGQAVHEVVEQLTYVLGNIKDYTYMEFHKAKLYFLLALCYQRSGSMEKWELNNKKALDLLQKREQLLLYAQSVHYHQFVIAVMINSLFLLLRRGEMETLLDEAGKLLDYQFNNSLEGRIYFPYYFLAIANYRLGNMESAGQYFKNTVFFTLMSDRADVVRQFAEDDTFLSLMKEFQGHSFMSEFQQRYF